MIKSYYDGPLSASLHNVHLNAGQGIVGRGAPGVRAGNATTVSESNLLAMSQSSPSHSPPLHHPTIPSSLPQQLKKRGNYVYTAGNIPAPPKSRQRTALINMGGVGYNRPAGVVDESK